MKQVIQSVVLSLVAMMGLGVAATVPAGAINVFNAESCTVNNSNTTVCKSGNDDDVNKLVQAIVNTLLFAVGIISVIMIIVGGIRYTLSNGDSSQIASAKNTVMYAVIGLVVSLLAYAIVNFVVAAF